MSVTLALALAAQPVVTLDAEAPSVDIRMDDALYEDVITLDDAPADERLSFNIGLEDKPGARLCVETDKGNFCDDFVAGQRQAIDIRFGEHLHRFSLHTFSNSSGARFDAAFREAKAGTVDAELTRAYELVNIAIAISPTGLSQPWLTNKKTDYHNAVLEHFYAHREHPFIAWVDEQLASGAYYEVRMNAATLELDADGNVTASPVYEAGSWGAANPLADKHDLVADFAKASDFETFFMRYRGVYDQMEAIMGSDVAERDLLWLGAALPQDRGIDHVRVFFSPLGSGVQGLRQYRDGDFRLLAPHIDFPFSKDHPRDLTPEGLALSRTFVLFTEMNHGFMPAARAPHEAAIASAMANRAAFVDPQKLGDNYGNAQSLFDEYMNWGLLDLRTYDLAPEADRETLYARNREIMAMRGFTAFADFAPFLLDLYASREAGRTLSDLYPEIIAWFEARAAASLDSEASSG